MDADLACEAEYLRVCGSGGEPCWCYNLMPSRVGVGLRGCCSYPDW